MKRRFDCKAIHDAKLFEKDDTGCSHFRLLKFELTRKVSKHRADLRKQFWDDPHLEIVFLVNLVVWPIYKDILFLAMPVEIKY